MLPGPVFEVELLTTARRARYYALRALYGLILLLLFWASYAAFEQTIRASRVVFGRNGTFWTIEGDPRPGELASFARTTFAWFAVAQGLAVLLITPSLVAGTIAGEKQRKTLHYLLASQLSSGEIVLGKLLARMLMVFVYLVASVPFLFLLRLFGGVELDLILVTFAIEATLAAFLASIAIFFSTMLRRARSAIVMTYVSIIALVVLPLLIDMEMILFPGRLEWIRPLMRWLNPFVDAYDAFGIYRFGTRRVSAWMSLIWWMVGLQWAYSALLVTIATMSLRRVAANDSARPKVVLRLDNSGKATWRALPRPPIGDDPMLWKERYTTRVGGFAKMIGLLHNLFWLVLIGCFTWEYGRAALREVWSHGYGDEYGGIARADFQNIVRQFTLWLSGVWILGTAVTAASSIASEREDDTWISLIATDLEGKELLRAKMLGSILRFRWLGLTLLTTWTIGVLCGSIHPLGFAVCCLEMAVFLWFAAALGVRLSLNSSSTSKSMALAVGTLMFLNGGYLMCCIPVSPTGGRFVVALAGLMPWVALEGLFSAVDDRAYHEFLSSNLSRDIRYWFDQPIVPSVLAVLLYSAGAFALTARSFALFEAVAGRPRRPLDETIPSEIAG